MLSSGRNFEILLRCFRAALWNFQLNCTSSLDGHAIFILRDCLQDLLYQVVLNKDLTHGPRASGFCRSFLTVLHLLPQIIVYWGNSSFSKDHRLPWQCFQQSWPLALHPPPTTLPPAPDDGTKGVQLLIHTRVTCRMLPQTVHLIPGQQAYSGKLPALHGL